MANYDPAMLGKFVDRLYLRANSALVSWTLLVGILGGIGGYMIGYPLIGLGAGVVLGFAIGQEKAFMLKVEAQRIMVLVKIEGNTRPPLIEPNFSDKK